MKIKISFRAFLRPVTPTPACIKFHDRVTSESFLPVCLQACQMSFALSSKIQCKIYVTEKSSTNAKSIAWICLETDTFEEFTTAVLQTVAKRCLSSCDQFVFNLQLKPMLGAIG